jgi:hypothetical protein
MTEAQTDKPLAIKLNLRDGQACWFDAMPEHLIDEIDEYAFELRFVAGPSDVRLGGLDAAHVFVSDAADLEQKFAQLRGALAKDGQIWVSWPQDQTALDHAAVRRIGAANGYLDTKELALDDTWSAIKFVIPKDAR